ncbi:unnamed protein product [Acanthoscelides obtectus]|uniref:G-protein coupled receptors family 1 profile domain-containing protein n=1 Tax=Acanthoscelides obtectus TaxID=200917 RepID=A0A9P0KYY8_ACAOB|nr:unnamed protein product [Acanthoscelides obtectus]CAK1637804.1 Probable G-protein coupled receptor B0563.6 [Acanthoscelides obtectus]
MGSVYLFHEDYLYNCENCACRPDGADVWKDQPTVHGTILYSVITPIICCFGICGNSISLIVLLKKELTGSVYTYLAVLAAMDLLMSISLFLGGLSRGFLFYKGWATYDALIGLPVCGAIGTLSIMATVGVTIDRVLYLWNPLCCKKPKFCDPKIARRIMLLGFILSILLNLPYCFIFYWDGTTLATTPFFDSKFYEFFNWFMLVCFVFVPAIILIFGNGFLIASLRRVKAITSKVGKRKDHTHLTITLISIIVLFLISEVPSSLVCRTRAVSILFSGDHNKAKSTALEVIRQLCTILGAVNVTVNFFFYYLFCPAFCNALVKGLRNRTVKMKKDMHVNVFVVNSKATKLTKVLDTEAAREYFAKNGNLETDSDSVEVCEQVSKCNDKQDRKTCDVCFIDSSRNVYDFIYN